MSLNIELKYTEKLQQTIEHSPSYRNGMNIRHTSIGSGEEKAIDDATIEISEQNLVLADASNWLAN